MAFAAFIVAAAKADDFYSCMPGDQNSKGTLWPKGDLSYEVSDTKTVDVYCGLDPDHAYHRDLGNDASGLQIYENDGIRGKVSGSLYKSY